MSEHNDHNSESDHHQDDEETTKVETINSATDQIHVEGEIDIQENKFMIEENKFKDEENKNEEESKEEKGQIGQDQEDDEAQNSVQQTIEKEILRTTEDEEDEIDNPENKDEEKVSTVKSETKEKTESSSQTNFVIANETQEVSSTRNDEVPPPPKPMRSNSSRRPSYNSGRSYAGGSFQNYGLTYLPYKSNFEPSEDSRRRADEFIKTLKL